MSSDTPTTILLSVHKGASTFLTMSLVPEMIRLRPGLTHLPYAQRLRLGDAAETITLPPTGVVASRVYPNRYDTILEDPVPAGGRFAGKRLLMLRRDPRDVAVSYYYSLAFSHSPPPVDPEAIQKFTAKREALRQVDVRQGVRDVTGRMALREFLRTVDFLERHPQTQLTTYEQLVTDFPAWIAIAGKALGWSPDETRQVEMRLAPAVAPPAVEDPMQHKRRVAPGNWREVFDDDLRRFFTRKAGAQLAAAGYHW